MATSPEKKRILWVDDEIDSLQPHVLFLEQRGFAVTTSMSGDDGLALVRDQRFDLVLLDEQMPGKDGLTTLEEMKDIKPHLPVVMVTKSEEETLMDQAIGQKIDDYLVKPVVPSQIVLVIKRILDSKRIIGSSSMRRYIGEINKFNQRLYGPMTAEDWYDGARLIAEWNLEIDKSAEVGLRDTHDGTHREWNLEFTKWLENNYLDWLNTTNRPLLSPDIVGRFLVPELKQKRKVLFLVVDCMRLDQWMLVEPLVAEYYAVQRHYYLSILPSATPFARNALFAGLFPDDIARAYPDNYSVQDEGSLNRFEDRFLSDNLARHGVRLDKPLRYVKVYDNTEGEDLARKVADYYSSPLVSYVFNFLDILAHGRSNNVILREIAGTEAAFRTLMQTWFVHSPLFAILKAFAARDFTVIVTSDHGSVLCGRGTMAHGRRATSTNLRYKYGDNLNANTKESILIKKPEQWRLPKFTLATTYLLAREDFYFVYPNNYNEMVRQFQNSFQHGGMSIDEQVVPLAILTPR